MDYGNEFQWFKHFAIVPMEIIVRGLVGCCKVWLAGLNVEPLVFALQFAVWLEACYFTWLGCSIDDEIGPIGFL